LLLNRLRRQLLLFPAAAVAWSAASRTARTQVNYPTRPVHLIVPFPPGGASDIFTRPLAQRLSERLGHQFYVENVAGAAGNIAAAQVARAAPDGYTVFFAFSSFVVNPSLFARIAYDPYRDFAPVTLAVAIATALVVNPSVQATTVHELIDLIKANPGKYSYASPGFGTQPHLAGEQLRLSLGLDLTHVPFTGAGPSNSSVIAGHTPFGFSTLAAAMPHVNSGALRVLAITSESRSRAVPDVPTMAEAGYPGIAGDGWIGVLVPAGTAKEIIVVLHRQIVQIMSESDLRDRLIATGYDPIGNTPEEFAQVIKAELESWGKLIRAAHIKVE
jgi:tripartite-type tricarboxylate transporter receptor subunit TctC